MEITQLEQMTKEEVLNFIRKRLSFGSEIKRQLKHVDEDDFSKEHRRFEMSGCEQTTGWCTLFNTAILNEFANLGIYDYTSYLFLDLDVVDGTADKSGEGEIQEFASEFQ